MPTTPLSGVRNSWLMLARKRDFACTAASADYARALQHRRGAFLVGDVGDHRGDAGHGAVFGQQRRLGDDDVVLRAVARLYRGLVTQRLARREHLLVGLAMILGGRAVGQGGERLADRRPSRDTPIICSHAALTMVMRRSASRRITGSGNVSSSACMTRRVFDSARSICLRAVMSACVPVMRTARPLGVALGDAAVGVDPHPAAVGMQRPMTDVKIGRDAAQRCARRLG